MKKNSLKLTQLSNTELSKKEMNAVKGGEGTCGCGCCYEGKGGSSFEDNGSANRDAGGLHSPGCNNTIFLKEVECKSKS